MDPRCDAIAVSGTQAECQTKLVLEWEHYAKL
jgi:hypothetical protein